MSESDAAVATEHCDVVVLGGTPGGIAAAVRAAREGLSTHLVAFNAHLGGMMAGGLSLTDTTLDEPRAPLLDEFFDRVADYYRGKYGPDSRQFERCNDGLYFEPNVAEATFNAMVAEEEYLTASWEFYPESVERAGDKLRAVTFDSFDGDERLRLAADVFVEGTYEGDLAAIAGVPYRVGRESCEAFGEQYAGRLFSRKGTKLYTGSTGEGDDMVQSYDYRLCLSCDPENRRLPEKPTDYDREEFLPIVEDPIEAELENPDDPLESREIPCHLKSEIVRPTIEEMRKRGLKSILMLRGPLPNDKRDLNTADLPGEVNDYPEADWDRREEIATRHRDHVLGMLYFLQNDEAVPEDLREEAREWGLPEDEFTDNDNVPFQLYVREGRRIEGRKTFTEGDARVAPGLDRAPVHGDAIAVAEYPMDSHDCRPVRRPGSLGEGHFFLPEITVPSQVPYGTLVSEAVSNLLVPVPLSATHVGFGTIRLEPTWMQIGEAAGYAAAVATGSETSPGDVSSDAIQRRLAADGFLLSYFEDATVDDGEWAEAVQYLGTKGLFADYDASPSEPLDESTARSWARIAAEIDKGAGRSPSDRARDLPDERRSAIAPDRFADLLDAELDGAAADAAETVRTVADGDAVTRGEACQAIYELLQ